MTNTTTKEKAVARQVALKLKGLPACGHECVKLESFRAHTCCSERYSQDWRCTLPRGHEGQHVGCNMEREAGVRRPDDHAVYTWSNES